MTGRATQAECSIISVLELLALKWKLIALLETTRSDNREFKKLLRRRQRERHKTIGFNEKTKALHVHFKFRYICSLNSAKQQREMTKFKVLWRT